MTGITRVLTTKTGWLSAALMLQCTPMPHLTLYAVESQLAGRETALISELTDAVTTVYGDWVRSTVVVRLISVPDSRWGVGGEPDSASTAPEIRMGIRAIAFSRDDWPAVAARLVRGLTDAVAHVIGQTTCEATLVELVPEHDDRVSVGGVLVSETQHQTS